MSEAARTGATPGEPTGFTDLPDLAARGNGGSVVFATDEFFAAKENLIRPGRPAFTPGTYGPKGQIYDGWETRRRRDHGDHDTAIVRLGVPGIVRGIVVDTAFFTGNYPPEISVDGCAASGYPAPGELTGWFPLVPRSAIHGDAANLFAVDVDRRVTDVRLCIYPDGGVARLRVHGEAAPNPLLLGAGFADLAALENGGLVVAASDAFYGSPQNLIAPGVPQTMGDGWETRRRRDEGNDWVVVRLGAPGTIRLAEIDTTCFVGNAPGSVTLTGTAAQPDGTGVRDPLVAGAIWLDLLPATRLQPDTRHRFAIKVNQVVTHVRMDVFPDGGMGRLRLWGHPAD